jgi:2-polyprenyl-3-methyl-5-hydroxy-6-metoxy-1,4-benzoquinol methylase
VRRSGSFMARKRYCPDARAATVSACRMRSSTRDLAFVVRSLRNAAHPRVFTITSDAATTWGVGEYGLIAQRLEPAAQTVVDLAAVAPSDRVLDVACGTGNAALLAARKGATVVGLDFEPSLLEIAKARARQDGLDIEWVLADIQSASLEPAAFTVVVSAFGVMYAPDHDAAAAALARCCAPGARLALAAWKPGTFMPAMGAALAPYLPPPPGGAPPSRWGDEASVAGLLERHGIGTRTTTTDALSLSLPDEAAAVDFLIRTAGHVVSEQPRLVREGRWQQLRVDLDQLVASWNQDPGAGVELLCEYLVVVAER